MTVEEASEQLDRAVEATFRDCDYTLYKEYRYTFEAIECTIYVLEDGQTDTRIDFVVYPSMSGHQIWHSVGHAYTYVYQLGRL